MDHIKCCLAYAHQLRSSVAVTLFSLASAIEMIEEMGFETDYYVGGAKQIKCFRRTARWPPIKSKARCRQDVTLVGSNAEEHDLCEKKC